VRNNQHGRGRTRQLFRGVQDIQVQNSGVQGIQVNGLKGLKSRAARGDFPTNPKKRVNADIQQRGFAGGHPPNSRILD
jgi:hypothetical protein